MRIARQRIAKREKRVQRRIKHEVKRTPRTKPEGVKEQIVVEFEFENIVLNSEDVGEFDYKPTACEETNRLIVVRKNLSVEKGEYVLFDDIKYFFYITNDRDSEKEDVVFFCNDRCNQENLVEQMKNGPQPFVSSFAESSNVLRNLGAPRRFPCPA